MPLAFDSLSHGTIAFGFFNIDSDMVLLDRYFFFATEFCAHISDMAADQGESASNTHWKVNYIADPNDIGDLMGAIHGIRYSGFIGEVYRRFPFPANPSEFKQKPDGFENRAIMESIIGKFARAVSIPVTVGERAGEVSIGVYGFTRASFHQLINYVWRGGYPCWKDEIRPDYVVAMKEKIEQNGYGLFKDIAFDL